MKRCAIALILLAATDVFASGPQAPTTTTAPSAAKPMSPAMAEMLGLAPPGTVETTTQSAASLATISIQAVQGTKGGPKITGGKATVELFRRGSKPQVIEVDLDTHGVAILEDLSLARSFQPRVTIEYAGTSYQAVGEPMTPAQPSQKIDVKVYETTDQRPKLEIKMRHIMAIATPEGLRVMDMLAVNNPADRAWTGSPEPDGKPGTMWVGLPAGATDLQMEGGFHSCCTRVIDGKLVSNTPLSPGMSQYRVMYLLGGTDGQASMDIESPAPVGTMIVMVPQSQAENATVNGLEKGGIFPGNGKPMQSFIGKGIVPGQKIVLTMTGMPQPVDTDPDGQWTMPQILGMAGGVLLVVLFVLILAIKAGRKSPQALAETPREENT